MDLVLDEDHEMAQRAARDFVAERSSMKRVRGGGPSRELWAEMAKLGWLGLTIPEEHGGSAAGPVYAMLVCEELGRGLMPEPYLSTVLLGAAAIARAGSAAQQAAHLPAVAAGERLLAVAYEEHGTRFAWQRGAARAERRGDGFAVTGEKVRVWGGGAAELFVVLARAPEGPSLFLVPAAEAKVERQALLDGRDAALVRFAGAAGEPLGRPGEGEATLAAVLDAATLGLCAEMLGAMGAAFDMTLAYLKTRVQFETLIGTFQSLQHRAARLFVERELARASVWSGHALLDAGGAKEKDVARAASIAKAKCSDAFMLIAEEAIQMHGGIGMTEEHDIGLYLKRARVAEMTFGDAAYHRDRFARLSGL